MDARQFDYLIDAIRAMSTARHDGARWVRYADLVAWMHELVRLNGTLMRPGHEVQTEVHTHAPSPARYVVVPLAPSERLQDALSKHAQMSGERDALAVLALEAAKETR